MSQSEAGTATVYLKLNFLSTISKLLIHFESDCDMIIFWKPTLFIYFW